MMNQTETMKTVWRQALLAGLLVLAVYLPAVQGDFLSWDDHRLYVENTAYQGLGLNSLQWMGTTFLLGHWQPLTWLSCSLDHALWGMNPAGWHMTNVLLHTLNTVLLYVLCLRCLRKREDSVAALLAALFYALHPLRVEAVAWLATRGYLLCTAFCLMTVLFYLRDTTRGRYPLAALFCFALAALSKGIGMMLPPVLLVMDWGLLRRIRSLRDALVCIAEKIPFFAVSLFTGVMAFTAKRIDGGMVPMEAYGIFQRIGQAVQGFWFYLFKTVAPFNLSPLYYQEVQPHTVAIAFGLSAVAATVLFLYRRQLRAVICTLAAFALLIFPMLGITQSGQQTAADRFTYLAALPFSVLIAGGLVRIRERVRNPLERVMVAVLILFGVQSATWSGCWTSDLALWYRAISVDDQSGHAHNSAGAALFAEGHYALAEQQFEKALKLRPWDALARHNKALCLALQENWQGAFRQWRIAEVLAQSSRKGILPKIYLYRGWAYEQAGELKSAEEQYTWVVETPEMDALNRARGYYARAGLLIETGREDEARSDLKAVIELVDPTQDMYASALQKLAGLQ